MQNRDSKAEAVNRLLDGQPGSGQNPHADKLAAAFAKKEPSRLPDFEKIRQTVLRRRDQAEADRRRFRRVWAPAAAAAVALLAVGIFFINRKPAEVAPLAQVVDLVPGKPKTLVIADSLRIHIRSGANFIQKLEGTALSIRADAVSALFDFEPNAKLRSVKIETPRATFSVIGTRFIVEADKDKSFLAVESGAVQVWVEGKDGVIRGGEFWTRNKNGERSGKSGAPGAKLFEAFARDREILAFVSAVQGEAEKPPAEPERRVTVTLKSGSVVSGVLISQTAEGVVMRTANQVLRFSKDEIAGMRFTK